MPTGEDTPEYVLGRDYLASARLNLQHYLWVQEVGFDLHPSIALGPGMAVIDIGAGTGIWSIDLALRYPESSFLVTDIDLAQTPPTEWLPGNIKLAELDVEKPIPDEYVGKFEHDPGLVLERLSKLLKPGGYIQWSELDHPSHRFEKSQAAYQTSYLEQAGRFPSTLSSQDSRMDAQWVRNLATHFVVGGLELIADEHKYRDPHRLAFYSDTAFMTWEEWRKKMRPQDSTTYARILDKAREEVRQAHRGISINMEIRTVVGRKVARKGLD